MLVAKAEATAAGARGEMPLDYMIRVMRDPTTEPHRRELMAKAAAPYLHPQLAANITGCKAEPNAACICTAPVSQGALSAECR